MRIALVGHSQIPEEFATGNVNDTVEIFKVSGAKAFNFHDTALTGVLENRYDIVILWIGSNDIHHSVEAKTIAFKIKDLNEEIERVTGAIVIHLGIEPRTKPRGISEEKYGACKRGIDARVRRQVKDPHKFIHLTGRPKDFLSRDGVHFTEQGKDIIKGYIRIRIEHHRKKHPEWDLRVEQ